MISTGIARVPCILYEYFWRKPAGKYQKRSWRVRKNKNAWELAAFYLRVGGSAPGNGRGIWKSVDPGVLHKEPKQVAYVFRVENEG